MLFDTHAHYDDDQFDGDRETLLASLPEQGVGLVVNPGCTVASSRTAVELARRFPHVYAAVGIHPENCGDFRPEDLDAIAAWLAGAPRYYLQNFVDSGNLIGRGYHGFTAEQLQGFAERVRPFFGAVELRGID